MTRKSLIEFQRLPGGGSDMTLKQDIKTLVGGLTTVLALRPVTWRWKAGQDDALQYGFIAQEVEKIIPTAVSDGTWHDGTSRRFLTVSDILPYLVSAIKEQQAQIERLQRALNNK